MRRVARTRLQIFVAPPNDDSHANEHRGRGERGKHHKRMRGGNGGDTRKCEKGKEYENDGPRKVQIGYSFSELVHLSAFGFAIRTPFLSV